MTRPLEPELFQPLVPEDKAIALPVQQLDLVPSAVAEDEVKWSQKIRQECKL